ncbi:MAG: AbrB/MazE/SpoVT family DNA-binding domain-containing protein [Ruminococcaceae bacterium]|nr:AbrB/MazE/SpoVT family DNA-binding domain-containing protein [Oscillospiraceae bacterium]
MKQIIRQIDETGRIVLPKPFREILGVNLKDNLVMSLGENEIILRKAGTECTLCGGEGIVEYRGILLCKNCVDDIATRAKD